MVAEIVRQTLALAGLGTIFYMVGWFKGCYSGHRTECKNWLETLSRIDVLNWQHVKCPDDVTPETAKLYARAYVNAYRELAAHLSSKVNDGIHNPDQGQY